MENGFGKASERLERAQKGIASFTATVRELDAEREEVQERLAELLKRLPVTATESKELDRDGWAALPEKERRELARLLANLDAEVERDLAREPAADNWVQSRRYVSPWWVVGLFGAAIALVAGLVVAILCNWEDATGGGDPADELAAWRGAYERVDEARLAIGQLLLERDGEAREDVPKEPAEGASAPPNPAAQADPAPADGAAAPAPADELADLHAGRRLAERELRKAGDALYPALEDRVPKERAVLTAVLLFGALGGSLRWLISIAQYIGNRRLRRSWVPYYVSLPFLGAGLAAILCLLLRVGILTPVGGRGEALQNLNVLGFYGIAAMAGLFAKDAFDKLGEVFQTLFKTERKDKDSLGATES